MKEDDSLEENPLAYTSDEDKESTLREMQGRAIVVDLNWFPEQYEDVQPEEEEPVIPTREVLECQAMVCDCMSEIEDISTEAVYERMT